MVDMAVLIMVSLRRKINKDKNIKLIKNKVIKEEKKKSKINGCTLQFCIHVPIRQWNQVSAAFIYLVVTMNRYKTVCDNNKRKQ